ncbi:SbtR family transcriptional regulator [Rhodococcoides yunnanense]|uniref:SbtR family transcriptional regulator n=1 Tax=Rhodococcoides yunnanense TaxID=278209 RepID=UPI0009352CBA|nr:TetR family transcriptional regulator [Rhodococcus yunnanensis]
MKRDKAYVAKRPKRADGQRNYDAVLSAAAKAFAVEGADASLADIAAAAGVAVGTLYGHFPTRECLVEASTRDGLDRLVRHADEVSAQLDPYSALVDWMKRTVLHFSTFRGLVGILTKSMYDEGTPSHHSCLAMHAAGAKLLNGAHRVGTVRDDLTVDELFDVLSAVAWLREAADQDVERRSSRTFEIMLAGISSSVPPAEFSSS